MYSLVLMAAMTASPEVPEFGGGGIGWDTSLCVLRTCKMPYHAPVNCCFYETCLPARYGWASPAGCCGDYRYGGSYGKEWGYGCGGCYGGHHGGGYGCGCGGYSMPSYSCGGCGGIYGMRTSCQGSACMGAGYGGGCMNYDPSYHGVGYAGFSGYGNFGAYGSAPVMNPSANIIIPTPSPRVTAPLLRSDDLSIPSARGHSVKSSIVLTVPENASVFIDGYKMSSTGALRVFTTPELEAGQDYYYTVRIAGEKDGKPYEESKKVIVHPGDSTQLAFTAPATGRDVLTSGIGR